MLNFYIITIFPEPIKAYLGESILKKAIERKKISVEFYNPLDWAEKSNNPELKKPIDSKPFGGGPGMVLKAQPFLKAIESSIKKIGKDKKYKLIYFSPRGEVFNTQMAKKIAESYLKKEENKIISFLKTGKISDKKISNIILVSGKYEGIDTRVSEIFSGDKVSVGNFVLTGGELPSMILIDSISRQIPGVLGNNYSREEERTSTGKFYTRPETLKWKNKRYEVPEVLLSGDHKKIEEWKKENK